MSRALLAPANQSQGKRPAPKFMTVQQKAPPTAATTRPA
jgi:hypothetical protein